MMHVCYFWKLQPVRHWDEKIITSNNKHLVCKQGWLWRKACNKEKIAEMMPFPSAYLLSAVKTYGREVADINKILFLCSCIFCHLLVNLIYINVNWIVLSKLLPFQCICIIEKKNYLWITNEISKYHINVEVLGWVRYSVEFFHNCKWSRIYNQKKSDFFFTLKGLMA